MEKAEKLNKLWQILFYNKNIWIKGSELCFHLSDIDAYTVKTLPKAELRLLIRELRNQGKLIVGSDKGYMLTDDDETIRKYLKSRWIEVKREMKQFGILAKSANYTKEQLTLWENEWEQELRKEENETNKI